MYLFLFVFVSLGLFILAYRRQYSQVIYTMCIYPFLIRTVSFSSGFYFKRMAGAEKAISLSLCQQTWMGVWIAGNRIQSPERTPSNYLWNDEPTNKPH